MTEAIDAGRVPIFDLDMVGIHIVPPRVEFTTPHYAHAWKFNTLALIEECGRVSHKSEGHITDTSAIPFIKKIAIDYGHESITEHASFTVCFVGSRAMNHQLVRHRLAAYTQESQRYCDYGKTSLAGKEIKTLKVIMPPSYSGEILEDNIVFHNGGNIWLVRDGQRYDFLSWLKELQIGEERTHRMMKWCMARIHDYADYLEDLAANIPPEDARFGLPNACKTEVYTTYNMRQWRHFFKMRCDKHAQWEIRMLAKMVLEYLNEHLPVLFGDLAEVYCD